MLKRILGLLGWLGVALVCAALAAKNLPTDRFVAYANPLAFAGLVCTLLYILSQWREIAQSFSGRQARLGTLAAASIVVVLAILVAINYLSTRHNRRTIAPVVHRRPASAAEARRSQRTLTETSTTVNMSSATRFGHSVSIPPPFSSAPRVMRPKW